MARQQISKHAKDATKGDTVAADRPARVDERQKPDGGVRG
jgi:hypothetical protein